ncbi:enoyl-ACP reductase FabI [Pseudomonas aeruginosa]|uniref:enoyl-ACP reductase FabI n=1 Tax=Citrobacter freundii TaxID=546 RepID=UPI001BCDB820|nr:enoyl-ACP reductase FabI [Citrobacter freundii]MBN0649872.1 enoyl-ACP reductase FabI [Pseudomonas aeruginosa]
MNSLKGQRALVVGIANQDSIAWGCAKALHRCGAKLAVTWLNAKAEVYVRPLAEQLDAEIMLPLDVTNPDQLEEVFSEIDTRWGKLDTLVHSIAFAPKDDLNGRLIDCSAIGFSKAMDVSVHSFLRMLHMAESRMTNGGTCLTVSFLGANRVVETYNMMGPVKAALECAMRYAAAELGEKGIRVHALSPGPIATRAASGIDDFHELMESVIRQAPTHRLATIEDVGEMAAFLASPAAGNLTGGVHYIDGGYSIVT